MTPEHDTQGQPDGRQAMPSRDAGDFPSPEQFASFVPASRGGRKVPAHGNPGSFNIPGGQRGTSRRGPAFTKKTALIAAGALVGVIAIVYLAGAFAFMDRFMPNTTIMGEDVSLKTTAEVQDMLTDVAKSYQLSVSGQDFSLTLTSSDLGTAINSQSVTDAMHADASPWAWPFEIFRTHDETDKLATSNGKLDEAVRKAVEAFNEQAEAPRNAGLDYDGSASQFVVRIETTGTALDADKVVEAVNAAVAELEPSVALTEDALQQPTLFSDDERLTRAADEANALLKADFSLNLGDTPVAQVDADQIADWMRLRDDVSVGIDEGLVAAWVQDMASACNTYQARRTFTRADGKEVTVSGGVYGWIIDKDQLQKTIMDGVNSAQTGDVAIPCEQEAGAYDGLHGRDWGPRYVDVDLDEQHARLYDENGSLVWESDIVTGTPDGEHDTPEGVYVVNNKESPSKLIGQMEPETGEPEYKTEVKTWMPFVENYIGFHDADWQSAFGGSRYSSGYGSHGCVNLPPEKSVELYDLVEVGDVVVSHW